MQRAGHGAIVNTASTAGVTGEFNNSAYVAAKHGVIGLTKATALENAHLGVRVNALAPGWVRTPLTSSFDDDKGLLEIMKEASPMHRGGEPEEMVGMVLFLCSDAASFATGQTFLVDGGQTCFAQVPIRGSMINKRVLSSSLQLAGQSGGGCRVFTSERRWDRIGATQRDRHVRQLRQTSLGTWLSKLWLRRKLIGAIDPAATDGLVDVHDLREPVGLRTHCVQL